jgi:hypothetical protein
MYFKLIKEPGLYKNNNGDLFNVLSAEAVSDVWDQFNSLQEALVSYGVELVELSEKDLCLTVSFPYETRGIYVYLPDASVTKIAMTPTLRPLMEFCYHLPNKKTKCGLVMWFEDFVNPLMSPADTENLLRSLDALIVRR